MNPLDLRLPPLLFFTLHSEILRYEGKWQAAHLVPSSSDLTGNPDFAEVYLGWSEEGIFCQIVMPAGASSSSSSQELAKAEGVHLFFDTRPQSEVKHSTRFCHHFFLNVDPESAVPLQEITRFRGEDRHTLADPLQLVAKYELKKQTKVISFKIPKEALFGFDPIECPRVGFTYWIKSKGLGMQIFTVPEGLDAEEVPHLWGTFTYKE